MSGLMSGPVGPEPLTSAFIEPSPRRAGRRLVRIRHGAILLRGRHLEQRRDLGHPW